MSCGSSKDMIFVVKVAAINLYTTVSSGHTSQYIVMVEDQMDKILNNMERVIAH